MRNTDDSASCKACARASTSHPKVAVPALRTQLSAVLHLARVQSRRSAGSLKGSRILRVSQVRKQSLRAHGVRGSAARRLFNPTSNIHAYIETPTHIQRHTYRQTDRQTDKHRRRDRHIFVYVNIYIHVGWIIGLPDCFLCFIPFLFPLAHYCYCYAYILYEFQILINERGPLRQEAAASCPLARQRLRAAIAVARALVQHTCRKRVRWGCPPWRRLCLHVAIAANRAGGKECELRPPQSDGICHGKEPNMLFVVR